MITRRLWLLVSCRLFEAKPIVQDNYLSCSREACLVGDKTQYNSLLSTSATLASLYGGVGGVGWVLYFSMLTYFLKAQIFNTAIKNGQLLPIKQLHVCRNDGGMHAHTAERCENGNDCTSKRSCNRMEYKLFIDRYCKKTGPNHILCSETLRRVLELAETGNNILNVVGFWGVARFRGNK